MAKLQSSGEAGLAPTGSKTGKPPGEESPKKDQ
jgi:hypothetical protein